MNREYIYAVMNMDTWDLETFADIKGIIDRVPELPYRTLLEEDKEEKFKWVRYPYRVWKAKHHKSKRGGKGFA